MPLHIMPFFGNRQPAQVRTEDPVGDQLPPDDVAGAGDGDLTSDKTRKKETNMKSKLVEHPKRAGEMITAFKMLVSSRPDASLLEQ